MAEESQEGYKLVIGYSVILALIAGLLSGIGGPMTASVLVALSVFAYVLVSGNKWYRLLPLAAMVGAHIAALATYYSEPVPIPPLFVVERLHGPLETRMSLNIDPVQIIVFYEIVDRIRSRRAGEEVLEAEESLKSPKGEGEGLPGPGKPR